MCKVSNSSLRKVCIVVAVDTEKQIIAKPLSVSRLETSDAQKLLGGRFSKGSTLVRVNFIIDGSANVVSETTAEKICALKGGGVGNCSVTIQGNTNVTLRSGVTQTENAFCLVPIHGNLTIDTSGEILIDASRTGGPAIQLYGSVNTFLYKVKELIIRWTAGSYSLNLKKPYAENKGTENGCRTAILHSDPYAEVDVKAGTLGYPRLNISRKTSGKFAKGDVITITANTPEGKRFKNWTWKCIGVDGQEVDVAFTGDTTASHANAKVIIS